MVCCLVALDKRPGVRPVEIGETLRRAIANIIIRAERDQSNTACGSLQLCTGLEAGIEGATHSVAQRRCKRHAPEPGGKAEKSSEGVEDESDVTTSRTERERETERVGGVV